MNKFTNKLLKNLPITLNLDAENRPVSMTITGESNLSATARSLTALGENLQVSYDVDEATNEVISVKLNGVKSKAWSVKRAA